jgi:hypothetical protein
MTWIEDNPCLNDLYPAILGTCRLIHNEAIDVLYGENTFLAHRLNEKNKNATLIKRASVAIAQRFYDPEPLKDASVLPELLTSHPALEVLAINFYNHTIHDNEVIDNITDTLAKIYYSSELKIGYSCRSKEGAQSVAKLQDTVAFSKGSRLTRAWIMECCESKKVARMAQPTPAAELLQT